MSTSACDDYGVKTHLDPQIEESDPAQSVPLECFERKKLHPLQTCGTWCNFLELWKFDCLYDDYGVKTHFVPQIEQSDLFQSVAMEASTRKKCFERKKLHPQRYSYCNNPPQTSGDRVIIWSFGNWIACTMTMGSKHTLFPKWKSQTPLNGCPWKRALARSVLRGKNSIRGGTHFAIIPFKRPEIR